jgi:ABC-type Fe3+/spermidine/putrescine transport system ATPase subunit
VTAALSVRGATKRFGAVLALDSVDLDVDAGEVLAVLGDNGAGKSTLIKCISGVHKLDSGSIEVDGVPTSMSGPAMARAVGIETVYQDLALFDNLDAPANFYAGHEKAVPAWLPRGMRWMRRRDMEQASSELLDRSGVTQLHRVEGEGLTEQLDWRWNLYINVAIAVIALVGALVFVPSIVRSGPRPKLDVPGTVLVSGALFGLVYGFSNAETGGWDSPLTWGMLAGAVVLLPLAALIALAVKVSSPGPVLFRQKRVGRDGVAFVMLKFRTMQQNSEAILRADETLWTAYVEHDFKQPADQDPRLTRVGRVLRRWSLDELPQIANVLGG